MQVRLRNILNRAVYQALFLTMPRIRKSGTAAAQQAKLPLWEIVRPLQPTSTEDGFPAAVKTSNRWIRRASCMQNGSIGTTHCFSTITKDIATLPLQTFGW
jgi:hypothetical protein